MAKPAFRDEARAYKLWHGHRHLELPLEAAAELAETPLAEAKRIAKARGWIAPQQNHAPAADLPDLVEAFA